GLANHAVDPDQVLEKAWELAREIATAAPVAVRMAKRSIYRGLEWDPRTAAELEAHAQSRTLETQDSQEGIRALLEKRTPDFRGR
ncbi:MAG: enoyl-CoA hydratase-related protein, partial [Myxococcota bacterium]